MKWSDSIAFTLPLKDVRQVTGAPTQDWEALAREREQAAYSKGRREGEHALSEQLIQQRAEMAELQRGVLNALSRAVPQVVQDTEGALIRLTLEAAQRIVAGLPISAEMVEAVVREALRQVEDTAEVIVQLHPDDLALLRKHQAPVLDGIPETGPLHFVGSSEVTRGGALIQTRFGLIDARREVKLEQLKETLA